MNDLMLFTPYRLGNIGLRSRIVMAPMTRSRAINNLPNHLMETYYQQRSGAGLIITEANAISPNGSGYARFPGIYNQQQITGWKKVTDIVHRHDGKIFIQLIHTGRVGHPLNMAKETKVLAPSAIAMNREIFTDQEGLQKAPVPVAMTLEDIQQTIKDFVQAALYSMEAGFDGVELHSANGYLMEQFISPQTNQRDDKYGGSIENRCRFVLEISEAVSKAIGKEKTGIRLSPYGADCDMQYYNTIDETYDYLSRSLDEMGLLYIHLIDNSATGSPEVPASIKQLIRKNFSRTLILAGGYDLQRAEADLQNHLADLIAFGRPYIINPDLAERFKENHPVNQELDHDVFFSSDEKGYIDYPKFNEE